jgi:hypothetical protein
LFHLGVHHLMANIFFGMGISVFYYLKINFGPLGFQQERNNIGPGSVEYNTLVYVIQSQIWYYIIFLEILMLAPNSNSKLMGCINELADELPKKIKESIIRHLLVCVDYFLFNSN